MKRSIVALTEPSDAHLELVQAYLDDPMIVIGAQSVGLLSELSLSVSEGGNQSVIVDGELVQNVVGVWYRKPGLYTADSKAIPANFVTYAQDAQRCHYTLLRDAFPTTHLVSDFYAIRRMENKFLQLKLAKECGFRIPETLFTSSSMRAQSFLNTHGECIVKTLVNQFPEINGEQTYFFARKIYKDRPPDFSGLYLAPAVFQQAVEAQYDARIVVIGNEVFGSLITNDGLEPSDVRDWRIGHSESTVRFEAYAPPKDIADKCVLFTKRANLQFSAFDFVIDPQGNYWFIEDNPNGQWGFVETETRQRIAKSLAHLLMTGPGLNNR